MTEEEYAKTASASILPFAEFMAAVSHGRDLAHRRAYEGVLYIACQSGPDWDDLPDETRQQIMEINREEWRNMAALGEQIAAEARDALTLLTTPANPLILNGEI